MLCIGGRERWKSVKGVSWKAKGTGGKLDWTWWFDTLLRSEATNKRAMPTGGAGSAGGTCL